MVITGAIICCILVFAGMLFTFPAVFSPSISVFFIFFAFGTLLLFSTTAPVNIAIMYSVPRSLKAQAMAVSVGVSHLIGDFPSPSITGALIDAAGYKPAILIVSAVLVVPTALWAWSGVLAKKQGDAKVSFSSDIELKPQQVMTEQQDAQTVTAATTVVE